jgi:hypothetical protein
MVARTSLAILLGLLAGLLLAATPATSPVEQVSLGNGVVRFTPPSAPWEFHEMATEGNAAIYRWDAGKASMAVFHAPKVAPSGELNASLMIDGILRLRRQIIERKHIKALVGPRLEDDARFFAVVYEKFERPDGTASQWHYYRNLPPHQFIVTALVNSDDPRDIEMTRLSAAAVSLSAQLIRPGQKKPPPPGGERGADGMPPLDLQQARDALAAAQKTYDELVAKAMADVVKTPEYQAAVKRFEAADAELKTQRDRSPQDLDALGAAGQKWLEARNAVEATRQAVIGKDPAIAEAKRLLDQARQQLKRAETPAVKDKP